MPHNTATLLDGREVSTHSEEWRHECEARAVADMPLIADRRLYLGYVHINRGKESADALRATVEEIFRRR